MPVTRFALALIAAASLNGSVALAISQPGCSAPGAQVCSLPVNLALPSDAPDSHDAATMLAPPVRPTNLLARHAALSTASPAPAVDERPVASFAPPRRPAATGAPRAADL